MEKSKGGFQKEAPFKMVVCVVPCYSWGAMFRQLHGFKVAGRVTKRLLGKAEQTCFCLLLLFNAFAVVIQRGMCLHMPLAHSMSRSDSELSAEIRHCIQTVLHPSLPGMLLYPAEAHQGGALASRS